MLNLVLANEGKPLGEIRGLGPLGTFPIEEIPLAALGLFNKVISNIVGVMTVVAGIWFIFQFIIGAIGWLTAGGDKAKTEAARAKITSGIIGLAIVIVAIFLIDLIGTLLGLEILQPREFILEMWGT